MWLSLIIALITYLLSPRDTAAERQKALLTAGVAGAVTYGVENYTDWGKTNLQPIDNAIAAPFTSTPDAAATTATLGATAATTSGSTSTIGGLLGSVTPTGLAAAGLGLGALTGNNTLLWIGAGVLAFVALK